MRIVVNSSSCTVGGGVQVAASFVEYSCRDSRHSFFYILSPQVFSCLSEVALEHIEHLFVVRRASWPFSHRVSSEELALRRLLASFAPEVAFTVFGPSRYSFPVPHVCGFALPWCLDPPPIAWKTIPVFRRLIKRLHCLLKMRLFSPHDFYWVETTSVKQALARASSIPLENISVIPNAIHHCYESVQLIDELKCFPVRDHFSVFVVGSPYPHKRYPFVAEVARHLRGLKGCPRIRFYVTIPGESDINVLPRAHRGQVKAFWSLVSRYNLREMFVPLGVIDVKSCLGQYLASDCVFLPTVLEAFSVSHLEAFAVGKPVVTSDLPFLRDVCGDSALYFDPSSPFKAANCLLSIYLDRDMSNRLVRSSREVLNRFPSPCEKYDLHIDFLEHVLSAP
jgi:glycosyltransferase involved in cell wall biosynthesis